MLKYVDTQVTFAEIPNEIALCINISNCPIGCVGCHSSYLAKDIGKPLSVDNLLQLLNDNKGITTVSFMGGDINPAEINELAHWVKTHTSLLVGWYSGKQHLANEIELSNFNFIKLGPYIPEKGPLNCPTTNQRMYEVVMTREIDSEGNPLYGLSDITYRFMKSIYSYKNS